MIELRPARPWDRTPPAERDYFGILGEGLVAQIANRPAASDRVRGWSPPSGGAWLHVGPSGRILAFTGKADVGQGTRGALTLVVAEELRVAPESVELEMADTDLCPWDMGTFGSRSMTDAAPALAAAAAGAREALLARGEAMGLGPRTTLSAADGAVRTRTGTDGKSYGELVRGLHEVVTISADTTRTPAETWTRAGHLAGDPLAADVVTGRRTYASDVRRRGLRYGVVLEPPRFGATLRRADTTTARSLPGVVVVEEDGFVGVVAPSAGAAREARRAIQAEWTDAPQPTERDIEQYLRSHPQQGDSWDTAHQAQGDPLAALSKARARVETTYRSAYIAHAPLETRSALAEWDGRRVTVWVGTQTPFRTRDAVAEGLGVPVEEVRIIVPFTGAGFGGKHGGSIATAAARLARAAQVPVLITFSRDEEFQHAYFRPMALVDVRAGALADGTLSGWIFHNINAGAAAILPPYRIADQRVDNELSESPLPQNPYRALAANANNFARESTIDELAAVLSLDPVEMRERNLADDRLREVLRRTLEAARWRDWARRPGRGHGVALGTEKGGRVATVAEVTVGPDRRLHVDRLVVGYEAGAIVHPANLRSQVEGAAIMALGGALYEAIHFDHGHVVNDRFSEYRVPRFSDLPALDVVLVDRKDVAPAGAGETPMIAVAPAIANAIFDAAAVRLRSLPLVPDGIVPVAPTEKPPHQPAE